MGQELRPDPRSGRIRRPATRPASLPPRWRRPAAAASGTAGCGSSVGAPPSAPYPGATQRAGRPDQPARHRLRRRFTALFERPDVPCASLEHRHAAGSDAPRPAGRRPLDETGLNLAASPCCDGHGYPGGRNAVTDVEAHVALMDACPSPSRARKDPRRWWPAGACIEPLSETADRRHCRTSIMGRLRVSTMGDDVTGSCQNVILPACAATAPAGPSGLLTSPGKVSEAWSPRLAGHRRIVVGIKGFGR